MSKQSVDVARLGCRAVMSCGSLESAVRKYDFLFFTVMCVCVFLFLWLASDEDVFVVCQITMQCHAGISGLGTTPQSVLEASGQKHAYCSVLANSGSFMDA